MISKMEKEKKFGQMARLLKVSIKMEKKMDLGFLFLKMGMSMKEILKIII